jgi:hypothetical protein
MLVDEKRALSLEELEAQTALELPDREMMQIVVVITNVFNDSLLEINVRNNNIAVQVCAIVNVLNVIVGPNTPNQPLDCDIEQRQ